MYRPHLLFTNPPTFEGKAIRAVTKSPVNHVAIGFTKKHRLYVIEASWWGVRIVPAGKFADKNYIYRSLRILPPTSMVSKALNTVGTPYSYSALLGMWRGDRDVPGLVCTDLPMLAHNDIPEWASIRHRQTPGELMRKCKQSFEVSDFYL